MKKWSLVGLVSGGILLADQLTKLAVWQWLKPVGQIKVIPGFFDLSFVMNPGVAFGMMSGGSPGLRVTILATATLIALALIFMFMLSARSGDRLFLFGLALVSGGAVGNLIDRLRLGSVIDFLVAYYRQFYWPAFNLADAAITVGTGLIIIHLWKHRHPESA